MDNRLIIKFNALVGPKNVLTDPVDLQAYASDSKFTGEPPLAVVRPVSTNEVAQVLAACHEASCPVIPRGAGTGTVGGAVPITASVVLELVRMNRILEIAPDEQLARVQAGVITADLDAAARKDGLFFAPDPASSDVSTVGGNAATCAGGLRAVRYGVVKNHVLGLTVVLADGRVLQTGVRTRKGVVGFDLTELFVGSEGTLGVITELTVRLLSVPETSKTLVALFDDLETAGRCVLDLLAGGVTPTVLELMDRRTLKAVRSENRQVPDYRANLLLIEVAGYAAGVLADTNRVEQICTDAGAKRVETAADESEARRLWTARKAISPALYKIRPHKIAEDVTVPIPKLVALIEGLRELAGEHSLAWAAYGHAGDGNLHANFLVDESDADEMARALAARDQLFRLVLSLGGTLSGEHGVGLSKLDYVGLELSETNLAVQRAIKKALDPTNLLNPGKALPGV